MTQEVRDFVIEKTKDLMAAHSCSAEAKAAAQAWLDAESEMGAKVFGGEEAAKGVAEHGRQIKAAGAKYCDCPACAAVEAILEKKEEMLK